MVKLILAHVGYSGAVQIPSARRTIRKDAKKPIHRPSLGLPASAVKAVDSAGPHPLRTIPAAGRTGLRALRRVSSEPRTTV